jgi:hypothetical protein
LALLWEEVGNWGLPKEVGSWQYTVGKLLLVETSWQTGEMQLAMVKKIVDMRQFAVGKNQLIRTGK